MALSRKLNSLYRCVDCGAVKEGNPVCRSNGRNTARKNPIRKEPDSEVRKNRTGCDSFV